LPALLLPFFHNGPKRPRVIIAPCFRRVPVSRADSGRLVAFGHRRKYARPRLFVHVVPGSPAPAMSGPFALIGFSGPDAATFLQGQLTQDVRALEQAGALLAAWCNPKGRVICVARLLALDGGLALAVPAEMADDLVRGFIV